MISFGAAFERSIFKCVRKANGAQRTPAALRPRVKLSLHAEEKRQEALEGRNLKTPDYTTRYAG
jgi:hypothetical protein